MAEVVVGAFGGAYAGKRVLVTGHTGFKGSWLWTWLHLLGAELHGYALAPDADGVFETAHLADLGDSVIADVRDADALARFVARVQPDFVFHLAAQPLVLESYADPRATFDINVMGSINLLEAVRSSGLHPVVVMVTTDKVYENREWEYGYRETDPLGGRDPYSASKAAMEIAVHSWRSSFFSEGAAAGTVATVRAGNVIGGGDWAKDRIVPDLVRALVRGDAPEIRSPGSTRPWQHVLEPLSGYLWLGARLHLDRDPSLAAAWNFGPNSEDVRPVAELTDAFLDTWQGSSAAQIGPVPSLHEAGNLALTIDKARIRLGWQPVWHFAQTVRHTSAWYQSVAAGEVDPLSALRADIDAYVADARALGLGWSAS